MRSQEPLEQCVEVVRYLDLGKETNPFSRCMESNGTIEPVTAEQIRDRLPPRIRANHDNFRECVDCHRPYWRGSHFERLEGIVGAVLFRAGRR